MLTVMSIYIPTVGGGDEAAVDPGHPHLHPLSPSQGAPRTHSGRQHQLHRTLRRKPRPQHYPPDRPQAILLRLSHQSRLRTELWIGGNSVEQVDGCITHSMVVAVDVEELAAGAVEAVEGG